MSSEVKKEIDAAEAISFRMPLAVSEFYRMNNGYTYPICPRCHVSFDREFVPYCSHCGQALCWDDYPKKAVIVIPGRKLLP